MKPVDQALKLGYCFQSIRICTSFLGLTLLGCIFYSYIYSGTTIKPTAPVSDVLKQTLAAPHKWMHELISENGTSQNSTLLETGPVHATKICSEEFKRKHLMTIAYGGRTGNLLFKFANLIATAQQTCYTAFRKPDGIHEGFTRTFDLKNVKTMSYNMTYFKILGEHGHSKYDENITSRILPEYNWLLAGYRQSFRYFSAYSGLIRSSFCFKDEIKKRVAKFLKEGPLNGKVKVGIHVRRTDAFHKERIEKYRTVSDMSYFNRAIAYMKTHLSQSNIAFLVVSDDMEWCKNNIKGDNIHYSPFRSAADDLYLLTQCDHNIVSWGTFGWMGAWLNESGIVVYDKSLYHYPDSKQNKGFKSSDFYPAHWVGL